MIVADLSLMTSGFCDRLRLVSFALAVLKLKYPKSKTLYIFEKKNKECPGVFLDVARIKNFKLISLKKKTRNV